MQHILQQLLEGLQLLKIQMNMKFMRLISHIMQYLKHKLHKQLLHLSNIHYYMQ